jgi:phosphohistidine phosphatase
MERRRGLTRAERGNPVELYLMRHGEAAPGHPDAERALTPDGIAAAERVAARAAALDPRIAHVYHSGFVRARQTAEILARALHAADRVEPRAGLTPEDPVEPVARWLLDQAGLRGVGGTMLVAHLPFLGRLAVRLVAGRESAQVLVFEAGALVKLVPSSEPESYAIVWVLTPELA